MPYIDLHVHSNYSDGTLTPTELVALATEKGLSAFALTDHDTIAGVKEAREAAAAAGNPVRIVPGVEISAAFNNRDIHILGINVDTSNRILVGELEAARVLRHERNMKMLKKFQDAGFDLTLADVVSCDDTDASSITRAHFARALTAKGYTKDNPDAFNKYLGNGKPFYISREFMPRKRAIEIILEAGGVPVLAHPLLYELKRKDVEALVDELIGYGLQGIEAIYSTYSGEDENYVKSLAHRKGLKISGGSDFHGANKPYLTLGSGRGNLKISESVLEELLA